MKLRFLLSFIVLLSLPAFVQWAIFYSDDAPIGFALVQETHNLTFSATGQPILTSSSPVTKGDLLVAWLESSTPTFQTIADFNCSWQPIAALQAGGYGKLSAWYCIALGRGVESLQFFDADTTVKGGSLVGVPANLNYPAAQLMEFKGNSLNPLDAYVFASGTGTTPAAAVTTALAKELVVGIGAPASTGSGLAPSGGWGNVAGSSTAYSAAYRVEGAAGSYTPGFTQTTGTWGALSVAFKPAKMGASVSGTLGSAGAGATVGFQSQTTGIWYITTANGSGNYTSSLAPDTYTVSPQLVGQVFSPASASVAVTTTATQNFTASSVNTTLNFTQLISDAFTRATENPLSNGGAWVIDGAQMPPWDTPFQILNNEGTLGPLGTVNTYDSSGWSTPVIDGGNSGYGNVGAAYMLGASGLAQTPTWAWNNGHNAGLMDAGFKTVSPSAFIASTVTAGAGTAPSMNTTRATLLVAVMQEWNAATPTMLDAQGNIWHNLHVTNVSGNYSAIAYSYDHGGTPLVTSASHSFSMSGSNAPAFVVYAFSGTNPGADPFDVQAYGVASSPSVVVSMTPTIGDILVSGWGNAYNPTTTTSITGTVDDSPGHRAKLQSSSGCSGFGSSIAAGTCTMSAGSRVWINNTEYKVASVDSTTLLSLTTSAGAHVGAPFNTIIASLAGPWSLDAISEYTGTSWPNDQWAEFQIDTLNSTPLSWARVGILIRMSNWSTNAFYMATVQSNGDGTATIGGPLVPIIHTYSSGDKIRLAVVGTTVYILYNGTLLANYSATSSASGVVVLWATGFQVTDVGISHFIGGSVTH